MVNTRQSKGEYGSITLDELTGEWIYTLNQDGFELVGMLLAIEKFTVLQKTNMEAKIERYPHQSTKQYPNSA